MATQAVGRRTPRRRGQGEELRREIVQAAAAELARTGTAETLSLRGVARDVGIATTSIYLHFSSLDELVVEVKRTLFEEFAQNMRGSGLDDAEPAAERIRRVAHRYLDWAAERPGDYLVLFSVTLDRTPRGATAAQSLMQDLERLATEAMGIGEAEAHVVTMHLWTLMHGCITLRLARPTLAWPELHAQVDDAVERLFRAS